MTGEVNGHAREPQLPESPRQADRRGPPMDAERATFSLSSLENDLFRGTFEHVAVGIFHVSQDGRIALGNRYAEHILGYSVDELLQKDLVDIIHPEHLDAIVRECELLYAGTIESSVLECQLLQGNGLFIWAELSLALLRDTGLDQGFLIVTIQNIEARKNTELRYEATKRELEENLLHQKEVEEKLRGADRAKDEFFAVLSHELRSPLNVILGYVELLKKYGPDLINFSDAINAIERSALAQTQLVGDLLEVSKIIAGKLPFEPQEFDPLPVITTAVESLRFAAEAKKIKLSCEINIDELQLLGDPHRMTQILANLLSNAIKFTPIGGLVSLFVEKHANFLELRVSDSGIGIAPEHLDAIFERYFQEEGTRSHKHLGLGLGLSIVKHLTDLHGGVVWAESQGRGLGASFIVRLPLLLPSHLPLRKEGSGDDHGTQQVTLHNPQSALAGRRILLVDDQQDLLSLLVRILSGAGARVDTAYTVPQGLDLCRRERYDLIISDIAMPEVDGFDFLRELRSWEAQQQSGLTPAIALSSHSESQRIDEAMKVGYAAYLVKPLSFQDLLSKVLETLNAPPSQTPLRSVHDHSQIQPHWV